MNLPHFLEVIIRRPACAVLDENTRLSCEISEKLGELVSEVTRVKEAPTDEEAEQARRSAS